MHGAVGNTLMLAFAAALIGFTLGMVVRPDRRLLPRLLDRQGATSVAIAGVSVPHYWLGMVLVIMFSVHLGWLPAIGAGPGGSGDWGWDWEHISYLILPAITTVGDPDGHHHPHGARAGRRHPVAGVRDALRAKGSARGRVFSTSSRMPRRPRSR